MMIFETSRLLVRDFIPSMDMDGFCALNGDAEIMRYIRPVKTEEESREYFRQIMQIHPVPPGQGRWAVEEKGSSAFAGTFAIIPIENTNLVQLGYALLKPFWGKGYATELTREGLIYYQQRTGATEIYAITESENLSSQHVLVKAGFCEESRRVAGDKELLQFIYRY